MNHFLHNRTRSLILFLLISLVLPSVSSQIVSANVSVGAVQRDLTAAVQQQNLSPTLTVDPNVTFQQGGDPIQVAPNLTLSGPSDQTLDKATVTLGAGFVANEDHLSLPDGISTAITTAYDNATGILTLSGNADFATYQSVLQQVTYQNTSAAPTMADRTATISLGSNLYFAETGHYYEFVSDRHITWSDAKAAAEAKSFYGLPGYLVTVTSEEENAFIAAKLQGHGWMGANDADQDKQWSWVTGPEAGTVFYIQKATNGCGVGAASTQPTDSNGASYYSNWASGEPNDAGGQAGIGCTGGEDYAHFLAESGQWNDFPDDPELRNYRSNTTSDGKFSTDGYVVEYGGMPGDSTLALSGEVTIKLSAPTNKDIKGNSNGDVHISTPDGLIYDYQGTGEFLAMQSSDGKVIVQARQETWEEKAGVSINTAVALWVEGDKLEFYVRPEHSFYVNDVLTELPTSTYTLPNGGTIEPQPATASKSDLTIFWPDNSFGARVIVYSRSYLDYGVAKMGGSQTYEGLLGNLDGNASNDLQIQGGDQIKPPASLADLERFGDSWRISAEESLFDNVEAATAVTESTEQPLVMQEIDEEDQANAKETCQNAGVADELALRNCTYDVAATGDEAFIASALVYEEDNQDTPPSARVSAQPGEALGGGIFDADQAGAEGITIMDGDDLILTTGTAADGTSYVRFNIYRAGEYIVSYSVATDANIADALAGAMAATVAQEAAETAEEELTEADPAQCIEGIDYLNQSLQETFGEADIWGEIYAEFEEVYLPGCVGLDEAIAEAAVGTDFEALELALQEELADWPVGSLTDGIAYFDSLVSTSCSESGEIECGDVVEVFNVYVEFAIAVLEDLE